MNRRQFTIGTLEVLAGGVREVNRSSGAFGEPGPSLLKADGNVPRPALSTGRTPEGQQARVLRCQQFKQIHTRVVCMVQFYFRRACSLCRRFSSKDFGNELREQLLAGLLASQGIIHLQNSKKAT
jgi:hypothetical protein